MVTSLTRSPPSQISRSCCWRPLMYCSPVRAGIAASAYFIISLAVPVMSWRISGSVMPYARSIAASRR